MFCREVDLSSRIFVAGFFWFLCFLIELVPWFLGVMANFLGWSLCLNRVLILLELSSFRLFSFFIHAWQRSVRLQTFEDRSDFWHSRFFIGRKMHLSFYIAPVPLPLLLSWSQSLDYVGRRKLARVVTERTAVHDLGVWVVRPSTEAEQDQENQKEQQQDKKT